MFSSFIVPETVIFVFTFVSFIGFKWIFVWSGVVLNSYDNSEGLYALFSINSIFNMLLPTSLTVYSYWYIPFSKVIVSTSSSLILIFIVPFAGVLYIWSVTFPLIVITSSYFIVFGNVSRFTVVLCLITLNSVSYKVSWYLLFPS